MSTNVKKAASSRRRLILAGGGHSHALFILQLLRRPLLDTDVFLLSDVRQAPYSGMVPGCIAGFYPPALAHINLPDLCARAGVKFVHSPIVNLEAEQRQVFLADGNQLSFDILSLNIGGNPSFADKAVVASGAEEFAMPVKPVAGLLQAWHTILAGLPASLPPRVIIVGAGLGGVELALAMRAGSQGQLHISLVEQAEVLLPKQGGAARRRVISALTKHGIHLHLGASIREVRFQGLMLASGQVLPYEHLFWATPAMAPDWLKSTGLVLTDDGFIAVHASMQSYRHPFIFAAGDVAGVVGESYPKSGVIAVRQARYLAHNIRASLAGRPLKTWRASPRYLSLVGTGDGRAIGMRGAWAGEGAYLWCLKDYIDRRFMRQFA